MGLGLSVAGESCGSWSYSGFNDFRRKIAIQVGIELGHMVGFDNVDRKILEEQGFAAYSAAISQDLENPKISWDTINDPIKYLLNHSDCDGEIEPEFCSILADRLEEVIMNWPTRTILAVSEFWQSHNYPPQMKLEDYDTSQARRLIGGLRKAAELNVPVEFH